MFFLIFFSLFLKNIKAQEFLTGLINNKFEENKTKKHQKKSTNILVELPFFDDFSFSDIFPVDSLWQDSMAFINTNYGKNPISIGVATLDAIDKDGSIYEQASNYTAFKADKLTSQFINLDYPASDSIYLSFFYQAQGYGDMPENTDSLSLEFLSPDDDTWHLVWSSAGDISTNFTQVLIPITDTIFLKNNFAFRFSNYVSLSGHNPSLLGRSSNVDHWNLDWIYLDKNRNVQDTEIYDICAIKHEKENSFLLEYRTMPWRHFNNNQKLLKRIIYYKFKNHINSTFNLQQKIEIKSLLNANDGSASPYDAGNNNIEPYSYFRDSTKLGIDDDEAPAKIFYSDQDVDSTLFSVIISGTRGVVREKQKNDNLAEIYKAWNDTIYKYQEFYNYYAYDDGTAENGYGISGEGSHNAMLAYKFHNHKTEDSLRAVQFYFNQTLLDEIKYFYLTIWASDEDGKPGEILYKKTLNEKLVYTDKLNGFTTIKLHKEENNEQDTAILVPDTFFVGWTQTTDDFLNVGYDNNTHLGEEIDGVMQSHIFFSIDSETWNQSAYTGALMIRPVFGKNFFTKKTGNDNPDEPNIETTNNFTIYPNPVAGIINIDVPNEYQDVDLYISIYDLTGRQLYYAKNINNQIDLSFLDDGLYFLKISDLTSFQEILKIIKK